MNIWYPIIATAVVFFLVVPGIGAVSVRSRWRRFRRSVVEASALPTVTYGRLAQLRPGEERPYRFFGRLEAIEEDDVVWLSDGRISVAADMVKTAAYVLPAPEPEAVDNHAFPEATPERLPWARLTSLPERTQMFVAGTLCMEKDRGVFRGQRPDGLLVILYDGPEEGLLLHSVWTGRQRNEYWNPFTPASLAVGSLGLLFLAYLYMRIPPARAAATVAATLALVPPAPLLPPGFIAFPLYRNLWRRGRRHRAERDLLRLPLRYGLTSGEELTLPDGERYACREVDARSARELVAHGAIPPAGRRLTEEAAYQAFGTPDEHGLRAPRDPMAEFVVVPAALRREAARSHRRAIRLEAAALTCLLTGMGTNLYLALTLASRFLF
ncbi:MAG: hypothetical protein ACLFRR_06725 [Spirochaetaceae bacterium]